MGYLIGTIVGGALFGLIPGIWAIRKGHKPMGIAAIVLCGLGGVIHSMVLLLTLIVFIVLAATAKDLTKQ